MVDISHKYRTVLKEGMRGHEVWALQMNLNALSRKYPLAEDGIYGGLTKHIIRKFQRDKHITEDGIAGLGTQRTLAMQFIPAAEKTHRLPKGLIKSVVEGESGWAIGATNFTVGGGADLGWLQQRVINEKWTEVNIRNAFIGQKVFGAAGRDLRKAKDIYSSWPGVKNDRDGWRFSVLKWNWPAAADQYAKGTISRWTFRETWTDKRGERHAAYRTMNEPANWIKAVVIPNVSTGSQWAENYIDGKTAYVTEWPP